MTTHTKKFPIGSTFAIVVPTSMTIDGFEDDQHPAIPTKKAYVFRNEHLRDVLAFITNPLGDALYLTGPSGSGKTSLICQVAARLNWPVQQVTCHGRLELNEIHARQRFHVICAWPLGSGSPGRTSVDLERDRFDGSIRTCRFERYYRRTTFGDSSKRRRSR